MSAYDETTERTRRVVNQLYDAYLAGDPEGMVALMADDVAVRFLGQVDLVGLDNAKRFFAYSAGKLSDLDFVIERRIFDGEWAAVTWHETAVVTATGQPWENHGVDVIRVQNDQITVIHENNDVRLVHASLPKFPG